MSNVIDRVSQLSRWVKMPTGWVMVHVQEEQGKYSLAIDGVFTECPDAVCEALLVLEKARLVHLMEVVELRKQYRDLLNNLPISCQLYNHPLQTCVECNHEHAIGTPGDLQPGPEYVTHQTVDNPKESLIPANTLAEQFAEGYKAGFRAAAKEDDDGQH